MTAKSRVRIHFFVSPTDKPIETEARERPAAPVPLYAPQSPQTSLETPLDAMPDGLTPLKAAEPPPEPDIRLYGEPPALTESAPKKKSRYSPPFIFGVRTAVCVILLAGLLAVKSLSPGLSSQIKRQIDDIWAQNITMGDAAAAFSSWFHELTPSSPAQGPTEATTAPASSMPAAEQPSGGYAA